MSVGGHQMYVQPRKNSSPQKRHVDLSQHRVFRGWREVTLMSSGGLFESRDERRKPAEGLAVFPRGTPGPRSGPGQRPIFAASGPPGPWADPALPRRTPRPGMRPRSSLRSSSARMTWPTHGILIRTQWKLLSQFLKRKKNTQPRHN